MTIAVDLGRKATKQTNRYCLVIGDTFGVSKNVMSRVVHRVSKAFCAMGYCIIPNVGCEGSLYI